MKTFFLTLFFGLTVTYESYAQTQKGTLMIGGSGSAGFKDGFEVNLNPNVGFFVVNNFALGSGLNLYYSRVKPFRNIGLGIRPFARYYFGEQAPTRFFALANAAYTYNHAEGLSDFDYTSNSSTYSSIGGGVGVVHFITEQVGLEAQLLYTNSKNRWSNDMAESASFPREGKFGINFGVQIHLPRAAEK